MRAVLCLLLLACAARAGEVLVRVTFGNDPVEGARVAVVEKDAEIVFEPLSFEPAARTDDAGAAVVDVPDEGRVIVAMAGYALAVAPVERETVDVALRPERIFTGKVFDKDGKPVIGARVKLRTTFNVEATFPARTGAEGRFVVLGLWLDDYSLEIAADGYLDYAVGVTEEDDGGQYALSRPASLSGRAVDADGKPLAGLKVSMNLQSTRTGEDGTFALAGLAPGSCALSVAPPYTCAEDGIVLGDGETRTGFEFLVTRPARVRWRTVDADGKPVPGVEADFVQYKTIDGAPWVFRRSLEITGDAGHQVAEVSAKEAGFLRLEAEGFEQLETAVEATGPGGLRELGDVVLARTAMVEVAVRLPDGITAPKGEVGNQPLKDGAATVPQGKYTVTVPGHVEVEVDAQPPGPVIVTMPEPHWLTGIALSPEGKPAPNVTVLAGNAGVQVKTNAEGRFRIGPLPDEPAVLSATRPPWKDIGGMEIALGEGEVVLAFEEAEEARLLRGQVLAGEKPVHRFSVNTKPFVDEEGRFELVVESGDVIRIQVGQRTFRFPLPAPDEDLIARLPDGRVHVTLEGGASGREVRLLTLAGAQRATATTDEDGIAEFDRLPHGVYLASAEGYRAVEVSVADGEPPLVVLHPEPNGVLRVVSADGTEKTATARPPDHVARIDGDPAVVFARLQPGEEIVVDLAPSDAGSLVVRGADGWFTLDRRLGRAWVQFSAEERLDAVPPGRYRLRTGLVRRDVVIAPGADVEIDLEPGAHTVTGRVLLPDGTAAHGASVGLMHEDEIFPGTTVPVDPRGVFRFTGVHQGTYRCYALRDGQSNVARIVVGPEQVSADGLPLVIQPPSDARARLLLPGGMPLEYAHLRIDGHFATTDGFGWVDLPGPEATLDLDLPGIASLRDLRIRDSQTIRLARGADLVVLFGDIARERIEVRVDGRPWAPLEPDPIPWPEVPGQLRLDDLPAGVAEVEARPDPAEAPVPEEDAETPPREPDITRALLRPGMVTTIDLRG